MTAAGLPSPALQSSRGRSSGFRYDGLPETLALNFPPYETPPLAELVERSALFELPRTASLILGVNIVAGIVIHRWERIVSSLLFAGAAAVQGVFFVALAIAIA